MTTLCPFNDEDCDHSLYVCPACQTKDVLDHVNQESVIETMSCVTTADVAQACKIKVEIAYRILTKLAEAGKIFACGQNSDNGCKYAMWVRVKD